MSDSTRIILAATTVSVTVGVCAGCVALLVNHPMHVVEVLPVLGNALLIAALASLPVSLPTGVVGGFVAAWASRHHPGLSTTGWLGLGTLSGALLGAAGAVLWFGALSVGDSGLGRVLIMAAAVGAVPGLLVGALIGAYCLRFRPVGR